MIRKALVLLLASTCLTAAAHAAEPGDTRAGTIEVTVTYTGTAKWSRGGERGSVVHDRKLTYRMPVIGYYMGASGWKEIDDRLPPPIEGELPEQNVTEADIADLSSAMAAAEARCGDDEDCFVEALKGKAARMQAEGKITVPANMPKINAPDLTRFLVINPSDCAHAAATASINDRYEGVRLDGGEGDAGLRPYAYSETGTVTHTGDHTGAHHCRFNAVVDTVAGTYSLFVPVTAPVETQRSDVEETARRYVTHSSSTVAPDSLTRWLDLKLPAGGKVMTGRRIIENIDNSDPENGAPLRAVIDWKLTLN